jgi:hypothetical protein
MKDKIASDKGRSGSTDQGGGGGSNKPVLVGGAAHSKAASHAVTGGFAFSPYDEVWEQTSSGASNRQWARQCDC